MLQRSTDTAIAIVRIIVGCFMIIHGKEIFDAEIMSRYPDMMPKINIGSPVVMSYFGKTAELLSGILLFLGLFTRAGAVLMAGTMAFITFMVGQGRFYMEDQHPFMFVLLAFIFFFDGGKKWSLDNLIFKKRRN
ncbi:MAG: DoxX family protein [Chitinophagaceae bacterium]|nr:DoxX family protein [Chitinophagaceae bacterium]